MAATNKPGGQRKNTTSASGRKQRSESSASHTGSRVEPSHLTEKAREIREKKSVKQSGKKKS